MSRGTTLRQAVRDGKVNGIYRVEFNRTFNVAAIGAGVGVGTLVVDDLPNKFINFLGVRASIGVTRQDTNLTTTFAGVWSVGSAPAAIDATLTGAEADLVASQAFTAVAGAFTASPTPAAVSRTNPLLWGAAEEINLNLVVTPEAGIVDGTTAVVRIAGFIDFNLAMW